MGRLDRRERLALDESYRYYRTLEAGDQPVLFKLTHSLRTLSTALSFPESADFKLTRQLWKRLQQVLFDKLLTGFSGKFTVYQADGTRVLPGEPMPAAGLVSFYPDGCKRMEDTAQIEVVRLYPKSVSVLGKFWVAGNTHVVPEAFAGSDECSGGVCMMKPMLPGSEVLTEESRTAKNQAYYRWWDLYWQAYCTPSKQERCHIYQHMSQIESVWGDLYY